MEEASFDSRTCPNPNCQCGTRCSCGTQCTCGYRTIDPAKEFIIAAIEEMRVWVILMSEHAKFIRMGLDPNPLQEEFFRMADQFAVQLEQLHHTILQTSYNSSSQILIQLREQTIHKVNQLIRFKKQLLELTQQCQALAILPDILEDHIRREADRFVGTLERSKGHMTKSRKQLGIPNGEVMASTVPRFLYHRLSKEELYKVAIEEILFFSQVNSEHAHHLSMTFRPGVQEKYRQTALMFQEDFAGQLAQAEEVNQAGTGIENLLRNSYKLSSSFDQYLRGLLSEITTCTIPTKQTNFPPLLADHMHRETVYYMDILDRLKR
ncbi:DUF2935 domain-containing protein [Siminovitchia sediminis]|uniref:DUF2935 domain-containing protein n=1 Tax=Siminovitchia sediminis TaxID=1274353 RepID=A0ABW4KLI0_9BACI